MWKNINAGIIDSIQNIFRDNIAHLRNKSKLR